MLSGFGRWQPQPKGRPVDSPRVETDLALEHLAELVHRVGAIAAKVSAEKSSPSLSQTMGSSPLDPRSLLGRIPLDEPSENDYTGAIQFRIAPQGGLMRTLRNITLTACIACGLLFASACEEKAPAKAAEKTEKTNVEGNQAQDKAVADEKQAEPKAAESNEPGADEAKADPKVMLAQQPGATLGDTTMCPVTGEVFVVKEDSPSADYKGQNVYFCCASCGKGFGVDPDNLLAALKLKIDEANGK